MRPRRLVSLLAMLVVASLALRGGVDLGDILGVAPVLLAWALLCCGRFPGEQRLVARLHRPAGRRRRAPARGWSTVVDRVIATLLQHAPRCVRGPPAASPASS